MAFIKQGWFIGLIGLLALCLVLWLIGPYIAIGGVAPLETVTGRVIACGTVLLIGGLGLFLIVRRRRKANAGLIAGMTSDDGRGGGASEEEVARLRKQFEDAVQALKESRGRRGGVSLYDLPWYVIIGPSGSGKSTILANSGLQFPLAARFGNKALRGVAGTRNCDWWFTDEAIFLDTAGRYTTQDNQENVDREGWRGFLDLLKRYRRRRPINGVLIAISIADLLTLAADERQSHVNAIRSRVAELYQHFGMRFPVYVLLTKCDLVPGFVEFFDDIGADDRAQVWGFTLDVEESRSLGNLKENLQSEFNILTARLRSRVLRRMNTERDMARRAALFSYPDQMSGLLELVQGFIHETFAPSSYEDSAFLRGVYLTSGTQEGSPIDRLLGGLARSLGIEIKAARNRSQGRSYFITRLLRDVMFQESGLTGVNRRFERQRLWAQRAVYAGALVFTLAMAVVWTISYSLNRSFMRDIGAAVAQYDKAREADDSGQAALSAAQPRLDAAAHVREVATSHAESTPWAMRFGLYQGDYLGTAAHDGLVREVDTRFFPRLLNSLAAELGNPVRDVYAVYEFLRVYLMLGNPEHFDAADVRAATESLIRATPGATAVDPKALLAHLDVGLAGKPRPQPISPEIVGRARQRLATQPLEVFVLNRIKLDYQRKGEQPMRLLDLLGPRGPNLMSRRSGKALDEPLSALYTRKGFFATFLVQSAEKVKTLGSESWVLGDDSGSGLQQQDLAALPGRLLKLYETEYINAWQGLLDDIAIAHFTSLTDAAEKLLLLTGADSPIRGVLTAVARETSGLDPNAAAASQALASAGAVGAAVQAVGQAAGTASRFSNLLEPGPAAGPNAMAGQQITQRFKPLNDFVQGPNGAPGRLDALMALLGQVQQELAATGAGIGKQSSESVLVRGDLARRLELEAQQLPAPVKQWTLQMAADIRGVVGRDASTGILQGVKVGVGQPCIQLLTGRYPLVKGTPNDVKLADFANVFATGGLLDKYFSDKLASLVDTSVHPWRWRSTGDGSLSLPPSIPVQFERAAAIRATYFAMGGQQPKIRFEVKPVQLSADLAQVMLSIDGQQISYRHGPIMAQPIEWPGAAGAAEVRAVITRLDGSQQSQVVEGPWALFRLIDAVGQPGGSPDKVTIPIGSSQSGAVFEFASGSALNPFQTKLLTEFSCPGGT